MILTDIRFHNTDSVKIFLHNIVQFIVSFENFFKYWMCMCHNKIQSDAKNRCRRQENHCHLRIYLKCHKHRKNKHDRCTDCHTDDHLICILHVGNVRCQTRYDTCRWKFINIGERKILYIVIHILSQVLCKSGRCPCGKFTGKHTEHQWDHRCDSKQNTHLPDISQVLCLNTVVDQSCHQHRNDHFHDYFKRDHRRR